MTFTDILLLLASIVGGMAGGIFLLRYNYFDTRINKAFKWLSIHSQIIKKAEYRRTKREYNSLKQASKFYESKAYPFSYLSSENRFYFRILIIALIFILLANLFYESLLYFKDFHKDFLANKYLSADEILHLFNIIGRFIIPIGILTGFLYTTRSHPDQMYYMHAYEAWYLNKNKALEPIIFPTFEEYLEIEKERQKKESEEKEE